LDKAIFQHDQHLPDKQAHIKREKTKEDLRPFLTILGTSQRASNGPALLGNSRHTHLRNNSYNVTKLAAG
jgi:hypothetical protein